MGHKVNPDIFRLGVSKKWSFQLRTNKNFLKNLFIFKLLKNLFINYNIPLFTWKKHRNRKVADRLILRGEKQIALSPLVKKNVLFSHVYFGMLNTEIFIESFFIESNLNQNRKKPYMPLNPVAFPKREYKHWQTGYYKRKIFLRCQPRKKLKVDAPRRFMCSMKLMFNNPKFKKLFRKQQIYLIKPVKKLSRDLYNFYANHDYKYNKSLNRFFLKRSKFLNKKENLTLLKLSHIVKEFYLYKKSTKYRKVRIFYNIRKIKKFIARFKRTRPQRYLKPKKYYRVRTKPDFLKKNSTSFKFKKKIVHLAKKNAGTLSKLFLKKISIPKSPMRIYNLVVRRVYFFHKAFHSLTLLKYFVRCIKFFKYYNIKKRIFFCHNLVNLLINFISITKKTIISKRLFILTQSIMYYSYTLSFWNFIHMKRKYMSNYLIYKAMSKTLFRSLIEIANIKKLTFGVTSQNKYKFGSSLVLNYILIKLGQYFMINEIVNPLSFFIKGLTAIAGYKIFIRGRLTRRERATIMIRSGKKMPLSTISANVDYCQGAKIMKFGMVGIKVYLLLKASTIINLYRFTFRYAKISE